MEQQFFTSKDNVPDKEFDDKCNVDSESRIPASSYVSKESLNHDIKIEKDSMYKNESSVETYTFPKNERDKPLRKKRAFRRIVWSTVNGTSIPIKKDGNTQLNMDDGGIYIGEVKMLSDDSYVPHGLGKLSFGKLSDDIQSNEKGLFIPEWCFGRFEDGKLNSHGILVSRDETYTGSFCDGQMNGKGKCENRLSGVVISGIFKEGLPHGYGICLFPNGDSFRGEFEQGVPVSLGTYNVPGKSEYEGEMGANGSEGFGVLQTTENNMRYTGEFLNNRPHGIGLQQFHNGDIYRGSMKDGRMDGDGMLILPNNDVCVGKFQSDRLEGKGELDFAKGDYYIGEFHDGLMHGHGTIYWKKTNELYTGEFEKGSINGSGELVRSDQRQKQKKLFVLSGSFANGKPDGELSFQCGSGEATDVIYKEGRLQRG